MDTSVYNAVLPTASTTAYDYIVDPQGLIRKTNAAKYEGKEFGEGTVFFENVDGDTSSYSNTSDAATIVNKSSKNLSVTVTATATPDSAAGAAALATSKTFAADNTALEVYLGITDSVEGSTEKALTAAGAEMKAVLGQMFRHLHLLIIVSRSMGRQTQTVHGRLIQLYRRFPLNGMWM